MKAENFPQERFETLMDALEAWFQPDNQPLQEAIERTETEGYFARQDIRFAILALKRALVREDLKQWLEVVWQQSRTKRNSRQVLCLHAGNIPLVGFQDVLVTLLAGHQYTGKVSKKDPYLIPCLLDHLATYGFELSYRLTLDELPTKQYDDILFSGSEHTVPQVKQNLQKLQLIHEKSRWLVRTAHFSVAYLDTEHPQHMEALTEAIFRYGGQGCRSVGIVVSPYSLDEIKCEFTDYIESFWLENPQLLQPKPKLFYRYAYNKAIQRSQAWLDHFLLQEGGFEFDQSFITYWHQGELDEMLNVADLYEQQIQQLYVPTPEYDLGRWNHHAEMLSNAQQPPLNWKPDGIDPLRWLLQVDT
ncbi:MAG: acyl-CoA reductase [Bacteroidota bacterium]